MEDYISLGHNHRFWNHPRSDLRCTLTILYGMLHLLGINCQGLNPLNQAYLAPFHLFSYHLCHYSIAQMHWLCFILVLCTLLTCYWQRCMSPGTLQILCPLFFDSQDKCGATVFPATSPGPCTDLYEQSGFLPFSSLASPL